MLSKISNKSKTKNRTLVQRSVGIISKKNPSKKDYSKKEPSNRSIVKYSPQKLSKVPIKTIKGFITNHPPGLKSRSILYMKTCENNCYKKDIEEINKKLKLLQEADETRYINWDFLKKSLDNLKCEHKGGSEEEVAKLGKKLDFILERLTNIEKIQISAEVIDKVQDKISSNKSKTSSGSGSGINKAGLESLYNQLKDLQYKLDNDILEHRKNDLKFDELRTASKMKEIDNDINYKNVLYRINELQKSIDYNEKTQVPQRMTYLRDRELAEELERSKKNMEESKLKEEQYTLELERLKKELSLIKRDRDIISEKVSKTDIPEEKENFENILKDLETKKKELEDDIIAYIKMNELSNEDIRKKHETLHDKKYLKQDFELLDKWIPPDQVKVYNTITECCKPIYSKLDKIKLLANEIVRTDPIKKKINENYIGIQEMVNSINDLNTKINKLETEGKPSSETGIGTGVGLGTTSIGTGTGTGTVTGAEGIRPVDPGAPSKDITELLKYNMYIMAEANKRADLLKEKDSERQSTSRSESEKRSTMEKKFILDSNKQPDIAAIIRELRPTTPASVPTDNTLIAELTKSKEELITEIKKIGRSTDAGAANELTDLKKIIADLNATIAGLNKGLLSDQQKTEILNVIDSDDYKALKKTIYEIADSVRLMRNLFEKQPSQPIPRDNQEILDHLNKMKNELYDYINKLPKDNSELNDIKKSIKDLNIIIAGLKNDILTDKTKKDLITVINNGANIDFNVLGAIFKDMSENIKTVVEKSVEANEPRPERSSEVERYYNKLKNMIDDLEDKYRDTRNLEKENRDMLESLIKMVSDIDKKRVNEYDIKYMESINSKINDLLSRLQGSQVPMQPPVYYPVPPPMPMPMPFPGPFPGAGSTTNVTSGFGNIVGPVGGYFGPNNDGNWSWNFGSKKNRFGNISMPTPVPMQYGAQTQNNTSVNDLMNKLVNVLIYKTLYGKNNNKVTVEDVTFNVDPIKHLSKLSLINNNAVIEKFIRASRKFLMDKKSNVKNEDIVEIIDISGNRENICKRVKDKQTQIAWKCINNQSKM